MTQTKKKNLHFAEKQPSWCMPCTDEIINYCLGGKMLDDHCCCEARHGKGTNNINIIFLFNQRSILYIRGSFLFCFCAIECAFPFASCESLSAIETVIKGVHKVIALNNK